MVHHDDVIGPPVGLLIWAAGIAAQIEAVQAIGLLIGLGGLAISVWRGLMDRNLRRRDLDLRQRELELRIKELAK